MYNKSLCDLFETDKKKEILFYRLVSFCKFLFRFFQAKNDQLTSLWRSGIVFAGKSSGLI
jgi:hypothetical protein